MVFKGTKNAVRRKSHARSTPSAATWMLYAKECIGFNIKVLDEHLPIAMDVLSDLVLQPGL